VLCKKPFVQIATPFPCGQCLPCRINRRRLWTHRIMLESLKHAKNCFVTLTYSPEELPEDLSVSPEDLRNFFKRLRFAVDPVRIRYFAVAEYGDETQRPHYHAAIFGLGSEDSEKIELAWNRGYCSVGTLTKDSAQYVAGYVTKKMTKSDDPRLKGRYPEFARMSLRPGIGAPAVADVAKALSTARGAPILESHSDVPCFLQHGNKQMPLGRYLRGKLRDALPNGAALKEAGNHAFAKRVQEMWQEYDRAAETRVPRTKKQLLQENSQKVLNYEARYNIFSKKRGTL